MPLDPTQLNFVETHIARGRSSVHDDRIPDPSGMDDTALGDVASKLMAALKSLATPPDASEKDAQALGNAQRAIVGLLDTQMTAATVKQAARELQDMSALHGEVLERVRVDRETRSKRKSELQLAAREIKIEDDATQSEKDTFAELARTIEDHLADDIPNDTALGKAGSALEDLRRHAKTVMAELNDVRRPQFNAATTAKSAFDDFDKTLPEGTPERLANPLREAARRAEEHLKRFTEWANVTTWALEDLETENVSKSNIEELAQNFAQVREEVAQALEKLRLALESARAKIDAPSEGGAFSAAQKTKLDGDLGLAETEARVDVTAAAPALAKIAGVGKTAQGLSRVRADFDRRIKAVAAPTGASKSELDEWNKLKTAAEKARDAVTQL